MKIAIFNDSHAGVRGDSLIVHEHMRKFYTDLFFPKLLSENITHVVHLGDIFDRRKFINFNTLHLTREYLFDRFKELNITLDIILGNHDVAFRADNHINSPRLLLGEYSNIRVFESPTEVDLDNSKIAYLPWIHNGNYKESMEFISNTKSQVLFAHLEVAGFEMYRGSVSEHGLDIGIFSKFDQVFSGHFHHKSSNKNIHYLGSPYELTWSDYDDPRGFHIYDTDTRDLTYVQNPYTLFSKLHYDDSIKTTEELLAIDFDSYANKYVKIIVHNKTNPYVFDLFVDGVANAGVYDLQIVDDHMNLDNVDDEDLLSDIDDTETLLKKYVDQISTDNPSNKKKLEKVLIDLLHQAQELE